MTGRFGHFCLLWLAATCVLRGAPVLGVDKDLKIIAWMSLDVKFNTGGWKLNMGFPEDGKVGWPIVAYSGLYAQKGEETLAISSPYDMKKLRGLRITSEEAALAFVRLFTREDEDIYIVFSSPRAVERDSKYTTVVREGGSYTVKRRLIYVAEEASGYYPLYEVEEKITSDGGYSIKRNRLVRRLSGLEAFIRLVE